MLFRFAAQINLLFDSIIATFLVTGSVSWLYYSDRLLEFPLGVFGIALATVILPNLSRKHAQRSAEAFSATLDWALRLAVLITLPAAAGLAVLSVPILVTLFQYQAFEASDVSMSAMSLKAYALGLPAFIAVKVLAPGYYARQDPSTPVRYSLMAMGSNMLLNLLFVGGMVFSQLPGAHTGLALASSVAAFINATLLYRGLRRCGAYQPSEGWSKVWLGVVLACVVMTVVLATWVPGIEVWLALKAGLRALDLLVYITLGAAVYAAVAWLARLRPAQFTRGSH